MISVFNEYEYAINILHQGFISKKQGLELFILAKYYRFECGKTKNECKRLLVEFCESQIYNYKNSDVYIKVNTALSRAYKPNVSLLKIDNIEFNDNELLYIKSLSISPIAQKVLFCLWCCNRLNIKAGQSDKWVLSTPTELKKICNLNISKKNFLGIIHELHQNNLIFVSDKWAICLLFLDNLSVEPSNNTHNITQFDSCGLWWEKYIGNKRVVECRNCGKLFVKKSKNTLCCSNCVSYEQTELKEIKCVDCHKTFYVEMSNKRSCRCDECYSKYRREQKTITMRNLRKKKTEIGDINEK